MVKISGCLIVKNEALNIERCLKSLRGIVNEIIVVDTGSTDETMNIAKGLGAKLFYYQWRNNFAAARNYALQQAKGDWIIFLDADEYLLADTIANVRPFIEKIHPNATIESVTCLMENTDGVDGPIKGCNPTVRIFRNSPAIRYAGSIHECIYKKGQPTKTIHDLERTIVIRHTGYTRETIPEKLKRNTLMLEEELNKGIHHKLTYHYLSDGYRKLGEHEKAIRFARQAIELETYPSMFSYKPYVILMSCMTQLGTYREAEIMAVCNRAAQKYPRHPEIILQQGFCAMAFGRYEKALTYFLQALEANARYQDSSLDNEFHGQVSLVYQNIAKLYEWRNDSVKALDYYVKTLRHHKYNPEAFQGLIALIRRQKPAEVVFLLNGIYNRLEITDVNFLAQHLSRLKLKTALAYYQNILVEQFGHREYGGMVVLCNGQYEQAYQHFASLFQEKGDRGAELPAAVSVILGDAPDWAQSLGPALKPSLRGIIGAYFATETAGLPDEYLSDYLSLLADLIYLCNPGQLERFLQVGKMFKADGAIVRIGDALATQGLFREAAGMFSAMIDTAPPRTVLSGLYCKAGFCSYRRKDFAKAAEHFAKSLASGYQGNDLSEFVAWSLQQCPADEVTEKLLALKKSLENPTEPPAEQPKIIIGITVRQKPAILREYLTGLMNLELQGFNISFYFIDDNLEPESKRLLTELAAADQRVTVQQVAPEGVYECNEVTHQWNPQAMSKVGRLKDHLIAYARQEKSHLFLVDSDLVLHPRTLQQLWQVNQEIVSEIFWTQWKPEELPLPQVWVKGQYTLFQYTPGESISKEEANVRAQHFLKMLREPGVYEVGGLGACTLIRNTAIEKGVRFQEIPNLELVGEDRHFCVRAAVLGIGLYVDTHLPAYHIYRLSALAGVAAYREQHACAVSGMAFIPPQATGTMEPRAKISRKRRVNEGKNHLTLVMLVRNEADRYLSQMLGHVCAYIDAAVIVDDASSDATPEICRQQLAKVHKPLILQENHESGFHNEINLRKQAWELAVQTDPDWLLFLDADEFFEERAVTQMRQLLGDPRWDYYGFRLYDFWDEQHYREDGYWRAHLVYRPFLIRFKPNFHYEWLEQSLHCGRVPHNITSLPGAKSSLRIKHLGWAREDDRQRKHDFYLERDPDGRLGIMEQYQSILDPNPKLLQWEE